MNASSWWWALVRLVVAVALVVGLGSAVLHVVTPAPEPPAAAIEPIPRTELMSCPYPRECALMAWELERDGYLDAAESMYGAACEKGVVRACTREAHLVAYRSRRR